MNYSGLKLIQVVSQLVSVTIEDVIKEETPHWLAERRKFGRHLGAVILLFRSSRIDRMQSAEQPIPAQTRGVTFHK